MEQRHIHGGNYLKITFAPFLYFGGLSEPYAFVLSE